MSRPTLARLLEERTRHLGPEPLLTYYEQGPVPVRVELSAITSANQAAKTASLLVNEAGIGPGDVVAIRLPRHWSVIPWLQACASIGVTADLAPPEAPCPDAAVIVTADPLRPDAGSRAESVLVSTHPLGLPTAPDGVPDGWIDHARESAGQPDSFTPLSPQDFRLRTPTEQLDQTALLRSGAALRSELLVAAGSPADTLRFATTDRPWELGIWLGALVLPLLEGDSCLWWDAPDARIESDERVDVSIDPNRIRAAKVKVQTQDHR